MNPIIKKISDMSSKNRYLNKYSGDVLSATLILLILLSITAYYQAQNSLQPIRNDWENQKCKINILPISGFIRPPAYQPEKSNLQYTADNYKECIGMTSFTILKPMTTPFDIIINSITSTFKNIYALGDSLYDIVDFLRSVVSDIMEFFFKIIKMLIKILRQIMAAIGTFFYKALLIFFVGVLLIKAAITSVTATIIGFGILIMILLISVMAILGGFYATAAVLFGLMPFSAAGLIILLIIIAVYVAFLYIIITIYTTNKKFERVVGDGAAKINSETAAFLRLPPTKKVEERNTTDECARFRDQKKWEQCRLLANMRERDRIVLAESEERERLAEEAKRLEYANSNDGRAMARKQRMEKFKSVSVYN